MEKKGFTLIETSMYLALLGLLFTGVLASVYQLIEAQSKLDTIGAREQEMHFVMQKLAWALGSVATLTEPSTSMLSTSSLSLIHFDGTHILMRHNATVQSIEMSQDGGTTFLPLTTGRVHATNLEFHYIGGHGDTQVGIEATTTIDGSVVHTIQYLP